MAVDYRLLHRFRVSQRREMAARGDLPLPIRPVTRSAASVEERPEAPSERPRVHGLTYLVSEDR
jgi:hypothetical protein